MTNTDPTKMTFFAPDPKLMTVDFAAIDKNAREIRAKRDAAIPPPSQADLRKEYNHLRQQLFNLKQDAKCFEIRTNEAAGKIRLVEQRIDEALKSKKVASDAGNLRGDRTYEQAVLRLETELVDAQENLNKNKHWNAQATRALKAFDHARIAELQKQLEASS